MDRGDALSSPTAVAPGRCRRPERLRRGASTRPVGSAATSRSGSAREQRVELRSRRRTSRRRRRRARSAAASVSANARERPRVVLVRELVREPACMEVQRLRHVGVERVSAAIRSHPGRRAASRASSPRRNRCPFALRSARSRHSRAARRPTRPPRARPPAPARHAAMPPRGRDDQHHGDFEQHEQRRHQTVVERDSRIRE